MKIEVKMGGIEHFPKQKVDVVLMQQLWDENASKMNDLFQRFFGLDPHDRYMGSFPYPDVDTGACKNAWYLSMKSFDMRNAIVASLKAAIRGAKLKDIMVTKEDDVRKDNRWPAKMGIVTMGQSITDNLVGEQQIQKALIALEAWLKG